jgi:ElaB/YqjD/DUF883 family membrane-anchored ribosome-binding protein
MHAPANQPEFKAAVDPTVEELNRIVEQAEALLRSLGGESGDAASAVRERVTETLNQAKTRLAATATQAEEAAASLADKADEYVRRNPWQAVAIAALLGGVVTFLLAKTLKRS